MLVQVQIFFRMDDLSLAYTATVQTSAKTAAVDCERSKFAHGQIFCWWGNFDILSFSSQVSVFCS